MEFATREKRPVRENVVPLINVVFLLLIFFMLTATLRPPESIEVELPALAATARTEPEEWPVVLLGADGRLALDGEPLETLAGSSPAERIELRADARVPARILLPLLEQLEHAGVREVEVVTVGR